MGIPLREILEMDNFDICEIVAGKEGLDRKVYGVTIMEAPDIAKWLRGGELILTSLYPIKNSKGVEKDLIRDIVDKEAAGLIVKAHRFIEEIPDELIEMGNELNFPIIEIPQDVRFVDLMYPLMERLFNKQVSKLKYFKDIHDSFTELALKGGEMGEIIDSLQEKIDNPIALLDKDYNSFYSTFDWEKEYDQENSNIKLANYIDDNMYREEGINFKDEKITRIVVPIKVNNNLKGYLMCFEYNKKLSELDFICVEQARTVLNLKWTKQTAVEEVVQRFKNDIINDLITGKVDSLEYFLNRGEMIGWDLEQQFIPVEINVKNIKGHHYLTKEGRNFSIRNNLTAIVEKELEKIERQVPVGNRSSSIILLWPHKEDLEFKQELKTIKEFGNKVKERIKEEIEGSKIKIGIGDIAKNLREISENYSKADRAINLAEDIYDDEFIISFSELGVYKLLCEFYNYNSLEEHVPQAIKKLSDYDKRHNTELLKTMEVYIKSNLNASKASDKLFIHYKTMLYRLERIEKITGIELDDYEKKLELELGLKILKIIDEN